MAEDLIEMDDEPDERSAGRTIDVALPSTLVRLRALYRPLSRLLAINMVFGYAFSSFFLLPKYLRQELAAGPTEIGFVMSLWGISAVLAAPFVGRGLDRFGRRPFILLGSVGMSLTGFGFLAVDSVGPLVVFLRVLQGVAFTMFFNGVMTSVVDRMPADRVGQAIGIFGISSIVMNALAPFTTEIIAFRVGWSLAFLLAGFVGIFALAIAWPLRDLPRTASDARPIVESATKAAPTIGATGWVSAAAGMAFGAIFAFGQPFALTLGFARVSGLFVAFTVGAVAVRIFFQRLHDRFGLDRIAVVSFTLYAFACLAAAMLAHVPLELVGFLLGLGHGCFYPAFNALVMEQVPPSGRGRAMTSYNAAFNLGLAVSNLGLGLVAEAHGYPVIFIGSAGAGVVALGLLLRLVQRRKALAA